MNKRRAPFIAFEGIDKCGKGTQSLLAAEDFRASAWGDAVHFSEPNDRDSLIGRHIRKILRKECAFPPTLYAFQRLYVIDRAQDTVATVLPAVERGVPVVAERFALSTIAYGMLSDPWQDYVALHTEVLGSWLYWPDITIILDIPAELAMERLARERGKPEYFEKLDSLARIRQNYLELAAKNHPYWASSMSMEVIDASGTVEDVHKSVRAVLGSYLA